jgi:putative ABC transport system substrate-binding protein
MGRGMQFSQLKRREFITLLGGAAAASPLAAKAQQSDQRRRIGVLTALAEDDPENQARLAGFRYGLEKRGWSEGRNLRIDYRFAPAVSPDQAQPFAKELVALRPDVIFAQTTPVVTALQRETRAVPIVFAGVADPVGSGFIASLPHPGSNITGVMLYEPSVTGKWLSMLKEIAPQLASAAFVVNPKTATYYNFYLQAAEPLSRSLGINLVPTLVANAADIERAIEVFASAPNGGLVLPPRCHDHCSSGPHCRARRAAPFAGGVQHPPVRHGRGAHVLRSRLHRYVSPRGVLCRPHPSRRHSCRSAGAGGDQV